VKLLSIAISCIVLLSGCASLKIQVGVLDPKVVSELEETDRLNRVMPELVAESDTAITARFNSVKNEHYKSYSKAETTFRQAAARAPAGSADRTILETSADNHLAFPQSIEQVYTDTENAIKSNTAALKIVWETYKAASENARPAQRRQILWLLDERENLFKTFAGTVEKDVRDLEKRIENDTRLSLAERLQVLGFVRQQVAPATSAALTKLVESGGLEHSPYAYYVANADDDLWAGKFDKTIARGFFGNSDIAIKALGPTNFTIKGLSFNPADVAATASKVATQTVLLASQIAGVPVKVSGTPPAGQSDSALAQSSSALSTILASSAQTSEAVRAHRESLLRLAAAILREKASISGTDDRQRREALDAVAAVYESNATRMRVITANEGG
jgi:hypothetical protein